MHFIEDVVIPIAVIIAVMALLLTGLYFVFAAMHKVECANLQEVSGRKTDFRWIGGCYVQHEGDMLPYEKWKLLTVSVKP